MDLKLLFASTNQGKIIELSALLKHTPLQLITPNMLGLDLDVEENGCTYEQNAQLKAVAFSQASDLPSLADDSGLEVMALGGAPGLLSARYSPQPNAGDVDRRQLLLTRLAGKPKPWSARFICCVVLAMPDGRIVSEFGECDGEVTDQERGKNGFGYDCIFLLPQVGKTMAELSMVEKNQISHRALAVKAIIPHIIRMMQPSDS